MSISFLSAFNELFRAVQQNDASTFKRFCIKYLPTQMPKTKGTKISKGPEAEVEPEPMTVPESEPELVTEVVSGKVDMDAPKKKRAKNAFMFYSEHNRQRVKAQFELNGVAEVAKKLGEEWRGLSDDDKKPYLDMQTQAKAALESN